MEQNTHFVIGIRNKIPYKISGPDYIVTDNSDYTLELVPDEQWEGMETKTVIYAYDNGTAVHNPINGNLDTIPIIQTSGNLHIGVTAGDIRTSTWVSVPIRGSIRRKAGSGIKPPAPDVYDKIMDMIGKQTGIKSVEILEGFVTGEGGVGELPVYYLLITEKSGNKFMKKLPNIEVDLNQIVKMQKGRPTTETEGIENQLLINTDDWTIYVCNGVHLILGAYRFDWKQIGGASVDDTLTIEGTAADAMETGRRIQLAGNEVYVLGDGETLDDVPDGVKVVFEAPDEDGGSGGENEDAESGGSAVDGALSPTSLNPVQNKVVTAEFIRLAGEIQDKKPADFVVNVDENNIADKSWSDVYAARQEGRRVYLLNSVDFRFEYIGEGYDYSIFEHREAERVTKAELYDYTNEVRYSYTQLVKKEHLASAVRDALERAKESGEFDGAPGTTPHIGYNGNWYIGETDTGVRAQGDDYVLTTADKTEIAQQAAGLVDTALLSIIGEVTA